jgi:hypothetical protein
MAFQRKFLSSMSSENCFPVCCKLSLDSERHFIMDLVFENGSLGALNVPQKVDLSGF